MSDTAARLEWLTCDIWTKTDNHVLLHAWGATPNRTLCGIAGCAQPFSIYVFHLAVCPGCARIAGITRHPYSLVALNERVSHGAAFAY